VAGNSTAFTLNYNGELSRKWNLLTLVYKDRGHNLYVNGTLVWSTPDTLVLDPVNPLGIGCFPFETTGSRFNLWKGFLDDVRLYSRGFDCRRKGALVYRKRLCLGQYSAPDALGFTVNSALGGVFNLSWDVSNLGTTDIEKVIVSITPVSPSGMKQTFTFAPFPVGGQQSISGFSTMEGDTFDITLQTVDPNYNLSTGLTHSGVTMTAAGDFYSDGTFVSGSYSPVLEYSLDSGASWNILNGAVGTFGLIRSNITAGMLVRRNPDPSMMIDQHRWIIDDLVYTDSLGYGELNYSSVLTLSDGVHRFVLEVRQGDTWYAGTASFELSQ
jgi:hypothetical protein